MLPEEMNLLLEKQYMEHYSYIPLLTADVQDKIEQPDDAYVS